MPELFLPTCEHYFRFLETDYNFSYISGLAEYKKGRRIIRPFSYELSRTGNRTASAPHAVTLYEKNSTSFEITYLSHQGALEVTIGYDEIQRLDLEQLLNTARIPVKELTPCADQNDLTSSLEYLATLVRNHAGVILEPPPSIVQKAVSAQDKIMEQKIRLRFQNDLDDASQHAAKAFVKKDYRRVIELLMPYENHLSKADMNKLAIAKNEILNI